MKYYKNPVDNSIHGYESDGSQDQLIDPTYVAITNDEVNDILYPLDLVKSNQNASLTFSYNLAIGQPITFTTEAKITAIFQADVKSRANVQAMLAALTPTTMPNNFYWIALNNDKVPFTYNDLQGLALLMGNQGWLNFGKLQSYKLQVDNCTTKEEVELVVWVD
jgi:hypothetical protein